jgi:hypothetical protein
MNAAKGPLPMRRSLTSGLTALMVATIAVAAPALAEELADDSGRPARTAAVGVVDLSDTDNLVALHCRGRVTDQGPVVACGWRAEESVEVSGWQLWRFRTRPESDGRELVAEVGADVTTYRDATVSAPGSYVYVVLGLDRTGEIVARSRPAPARVGEDPPGGIHLGCQLRWNPSAADFVADRVEAADHLRRPAIGCRWSPSDRADIRAYVVLRSVDGEPRTVISEVREDVTSIVDHPVAFGHSYTYLVRGLDAEGRVVAHSRPVKVGVPRWHLDWPTDRLHDRWSGGVGVDDVEDSTGRQSDPDGDRLVDHDVDARSDHETDQTIDGGREADVDRVADSAADTGTEVGWHPAPAESRLLETADPVFERPRDAEPATDRLPADH